jgi:hypothetical protein
VNNCVAIFNQKYFLLFLLYTCVCCIYSGVLLVLRFISCTHNLKACSISGAQSILCILHFIEAVVFGLFCAIMMWDQLSAIFENTPGIDALQERKGQRRGKYESLQEVFGERLCWRWWLPISMPAKIYVDFQLELETLEDPMTDELFQEEQARRFEYAQGLPLEERQRVMQEELYPPTSHNSHSHAHSHSHGGSNGHNHSHGNGAAPVVFPDGFVSDELNDLRREEDVDPALAALQSPPRSPNLAALPPREDVVHKKSK